MSKLLEQIKAYETNTRVAQPLQMVSVTKDVYEIPRPESAIVYTVKATLGASVVVTDSLKETVDWQTVVKQKVYRPLAEEIFGEFRKPLLDADLAIYTGDMQKASSLIRQVLDSMFAV